MQDQNIALVQVQTKDLLYSVIQNNMLDTSMMTKDAIWYTESTVLHLDRHEVEYYLEHTLFATVEEEPQVSFLESNYIGTGGISLMGHVEYQDKSQRDSHLKVRFFAIWEQHGEAWRLKQLVTAQREVKKEENRAKKERTSGNINDTKLLQSFPVGLICCTGEDPLPIRRMNEKMLAMLGYASINDYNQYAGTLLLSSLHPEDIKRLQDYAHSIEGDQSQESILVRVRKKDYFYITLQIFGSRMENGWLLFVCLDYSEQKERMDSLKEKSEKLAELRDEYRILIDNLPTGFHRCALYDPVHVEYVSDSFCDMTGYTQQDIHGEMQSHYSEMIVPEDRNSFREAIESLMQYPHTMQLVYRIRKKDGNEIRVMDRMRSVRHSDGKMWGYSVVVDLDEHPMAHPRSNMSQSSLPLHHPITDRAHRVEIHTFGYFEVLLDNRPIAFRSAKARELLALLVDRKGNFASREVIISTLWESETVNPTTLARCRKTYMNLVAELKNYGIEDILETENGQRRIIPEKVKCDLFDYKNGVPEVQSLFRGEYLNEYSWSELTLASLLPTES